jgi:ubiquitin related modifier 1
MKLQIVFNGGLEFLFKGDKLVYESDKTMTLKDLIIELKGKIDKPHLFVGEGNSVRPGILVLINDTDYELLEGIDYVLKDRDEIIFISTLHGG